MTDTTHLTVVAQQVHLTVPLDIVQIAFTLLEWRDSLKRTLTTTLTRWTS